MDLTGLFEIQRLLDAKIGQKLEIKRIDRLDKKFLALFTEIGECANEWRGFKFWSTKQKPNNCVRTTKGATKQNVIELFCSSCGDSTGKEHEWFDRILKDDYNKCLHCGEPQVNFMTEINPLLEEYVDAIHFLLSLGNEFGYEKVNFQQELIEYHEVGKTFKERNVTRQFNNVFNMAIEFEDTRDETEYIELVLVYIALGEMLGFTWKQVEEAYYAKNEINHQRQAEGY